MTRSKSIVIIWHIIVFMRGIEYMACGWNLVISRRLKNRCRSICGRSPSTRSIRIGSGNTGGLWTAWSSCYLLLFWCRCGGRPRSIWDRARDQWKSRWRARVGQINGIGEGAVGSTCVCRVGVIVALIWARLLLPILNTCRCVCPKTNFTHDFYLWGHAGFNHLPSWGERLFSVSVGVGLR